MSIVSLIAGRALKSIRPEAAVTWLAELVSVSTEAPEGGSAERPQVFAADLV